MATQRFFIANLTSGLVANPDPWLIMDDAWANLANVHVWRGKVVKRIGAKEMDTSQSADTRQLFTRLRIKIGTTDINGDLGATNIPGATASVVNRIGQIFSADDEIYTVTIIGSPATLITSGLGIPTYNTTAPNAGQFTLTGGPVLTDVYFYPSFPVMALPSYENAAINAEPLVAFDTKYAYTYIAGNGWDALPSAAGTPIWTGTDADFHWTCNWRGTLGSEYLLFVVNGVVADQISYWNGTVWTRFEPVYDTVTARVIRTGKIILPFKGRLLLINTIEQGAAGNLSFVNRVRYSQQGDPTIAATSWDDRVTGRGGFVDLTSREAIISAEFIRDRLIIFCENSTWELVYTGNEVFPFRFQKINTELGVESIKSIVPFDKQVLGFGSTGIHACNGMNVQRIDDQIPDTIFSILNDSGGPQRVQGIRDYYSEEAYWSFTSAQTGTKFPNTMLVYNYKTGAWAFNNESATAFGYYQSSNAQRWQDLTSTWQDGDEQWFDPADISLFRDIVAGNQEGFTFLLTHTKSSNSIALSITNIAVVNNTVTFTVIDHNLTVGTYINIQSAQGLLGLSSTTINYRINTVTDENTFSIMLAGVTGTYLGGGRIIRIDQFFLYSKQYNFFNETGNRIHIPRIDFLVDKIQAGTIQLGFLPSFSEWNDLVPAGQITGSNVGDYKIDMGQITPQEADQTKVWRSIYPLFEGDVCQVILYQSEDSLALVAEATKEFRLHAMIFHARQINDLGS